MRAAHKYPRKANFFSSARFRSHLEDFDVVVSGSALHKRERIWLHAMLPIPAYRGSTPDGIDYDRGIVIVSTVRIARIRIIIKGRQVKCILATGEGQGDN